MHVWRVGRCLPACVEGGDVPACMCGRWGRACMQVGRCLYACVEGGEVHACLCGVEVGAKVYHPPPTCPSPPSHPPQDPGLMCLAHFHGARVVLNAGDVSPAFTSAEARHAWVCVHACAWPGCKRMCMPGCKRMCMPGVLGCMCNCACISWLAWMWAHAYAWRALVRVHAIHAYAWRAWVWAHAYAWRALGACACICLACLGVSACMLLMTVWIWHWGKLMRICLPCNHQHTTGGGPAASGI